jgi:hypothetical protein
MENRKWSIVSRGAGATLVADRSQGGSFRSLFGRPTRRLLTEEKAPTVGPSVSSTHPACPCEGRDPVPDRGLGQALCREGRGPHRIARQAHRRTQESTATPPKSLP